MKPLGGLSQDCWALGLGTCPRPWNSKGRAGVDLFGNIRKGSQLLQQVDREARARTWMDTLEWLSFLEGYTPSFQSDGSAMLN